MSTMGLYLPRQSPLHRLRAGVKLVALLLAGIASIFVDHTWQMVLAVAGIGTGYIYGGFGPRVFIGQVRPLFWILLAVGVFHGFVSGPARATVVVGMIIALVLLAGLVTLTTRSQDLVDALVVALRPLRRFGLDAERFGLLLALSLRSVPVMIGLAEEIRDAQRARGLSASPRAFAVPLIIRALRHADSLGEALVARGVDD